MSRKLLRIRQLRNLAEAGGVTIHAGSLGLLGGSKGKVGPGLLAVRLSKSVHRVEGRV